MGQLKRVAEVTHMGIQPFIIVGDFNHDGAELSRHWMIQQLGAVIMQPATGATCHAGATGSCIDFAIVAKCVRPYLEIVADDTVPWGPHDGIRITMDKRAAAARRTVVCTRPLALWHKREKEVPPALAWEDAKEAARREVGPTHRIEGAVERALEGLGTTNEAQQMGIDYARWARAIELQALSQQGIDSKGELGKAMTGRGQPPRIKEVNVRPGHQGDTRKATEVPIEAYECMLWARLRAMMSKLLCEARTGVAERKARWRGHIMNEVASRHPNVVRVWTATKQPADHNAVLWAIMRALGSSATEDDIQTSVTTLGRVEKATRGRLKNIKSAAWTKWARKAADDNSKAAFKWCNAPNETALELTGAETDDISDIVQKHAQKWSDVWACKDEEAQGEAMRYAAALRAQAMDTDEARASAEYVTVANLDKVVGRFKGNTGSSDNFGKYDILMATREAKEELCAMLRKTIVRQAWPAQCHAPTMLLRAKKAAGSRCTALGAMYWRIGMGMLGLEVREWEARNPRMGDTAGKGRSAEQAAALRSTRAEVASYTGFDTIILGLDATEYFDRLQGNMTANTAIDDGMPFPALALATQIYRSPRRLIHGGACSSLLESPARSVLPGCALAPAMAKCTSQAAAECARATTRVTTTEAHIDDLTQVTVVRAQKGEHNVDAVRHAAAAAISMISELQRRKVVISTKSRLVASRPPLAHRVAALVLKATGQRIQVQGALPDLGVGTTAGQRRCTEIAQPRLLKGSNSAKRVGAPSRLSTRARKMAQGGVMSKMTYGGTCQGTSPAMVSQMRTAMATAAGPVGRHSCRTSTIWWYLGRKADPTLTTPAAQVKTFMAAWENADPRLRRDIADTWKALSIQAEAGVLVWRAIRGVIGATILTLHELGWRPHKLQEVIDHEGFRYNLAEHTKGRSYRVLLEAVEDAAARKAWRDTAKHRHGAGLAEGVPALAPARAARRWLVRHELYEAAKALDALVEGAMWQGPTRPCWRCGQPDSAQHRYYECDGLKEHEMEEIGKSNWLREAKAKTDEQHGQLECLWYRGILPAQLHDIEQEHADTSSAQMWSTPNFGDLLNEVGEAHCDGSGNARGGNALHPKSGSGAAVLQWNEAKDTVVGAALLGAQVPAAQTAPRAEAWSTRNVARAATRAVRVRQDAKYVVNGIQGGEEAQRKLITGGNGDIWRELIDDSTTGPITMEWTPGHPQADDIRENRVSIEQALGNVVADACAGAAALRLQRDDAASEAIKEWDRNAFWVARRIAILEAESWRGERPLVHAIEAVQAATTEDMTRNAAKTVQEQIQAAGHRLFRHGLHTRCALCRKSTKKHFEQWLRPCTRAAPDKERKRPRSTEHTEATEEREEHGTDSERNAGAEAAAMTPRLTPRHPTDAAELVSPAKRRRQVKEARATLKDLADKESDIVRQQLRARSEVVPPSTDEWHRNLPQADEGAQLPPQQLDDTHVYIVVGGFAGCLKCGGIGGAHASKLLTLPCRRAPPPCGFTWPIRSLMRGELPHRQRSGQGEAWPSGESNPTVRRWQPVAKRAREPQDEERRRLRSKQAAPQYGNAEAAEATAATVATPRADDAEAEAVAATAATPRAESREDEEGATAVPQRPTARIQRSRFVF